MTPTASTSNYIDDRQTTTPWLNVFFALPGNDAPEHAHRKLRNLSSLVLIGFAFDYFTLSIRIEQFPWRSDWRLLVCSATLLAALAIQVRKTFAPRTAQAAAALLILFIVLSGPLVANHIVLAAICLVFIAIGTHKNSPIESQLALQSIKWVGAIVLFATGVQKVLYGHYFDGQMLGYLISELERFRIFFSLILPDDEIHRLAALQFEPGQGPYRSTMLLSCISLAVIIGELLLPVLFMSERWRKPSVVGGIILVCALQLGALELAFMFLMTAILVMYLPVRASTWMVRLAPLAFFLGLYVKPW